MAVPDPDLEMGGGGARGGPLDPEISGGGRSPKNFFWPFRSQFGLKIRGGGGGAGPSLGSATKWQLLGIAFSKVSLLLGIQTVQCDDY